MRRGKYTHSGDEVDVDDYTGVFGEDELEWYHGLDVWETGG